MPVNVPAAGSVRGGGLRLSTDKVKILFLVGMGRSGTTLLSRLLDGEHGYRAVGELRYLADPLLHEVPCGCGVDQFRCESWRPLLSRLAEPERRAAWRRVVFAPQHVQLAALLAPGASTGRLQASCDVLRDTYQALAAHHQVVVDESKTPWFGYLLAIQPWTDVRFVELMRPPADVIRSRTSAKNYQLTTPREYTARLWLRTWLTNVVVRARTDAPWLRIAYRDLVDEPGETLREILGHPPQNLHREQREWVFESRPTHIFRSNSDKLRRGRDTVRPAPPASPSLPGAGPWERLAGGVWEHWLRHRVRLVRRWTPATPTSVDVAVPESRTGEVGRIGQAHQVGAASVASGSA